VARELDAIIAERGRPDMIVSDNGTELTSNAIFGWADETEIGWHYIAPGKPLLRDILAESQRRSG
jgi:putative transposase